MPVRVAETSKDLAPPTSTRTMAALSAELPGRCGLRRYRRAHTGAMALVVVDAENTRRSQWPNVSREELLRRARAWAEHEGHELLVVFDGAAPEDAPDVVGSRNADDAIVELVPQLASPWWLVTSDRGLRERVGDRPERVIGGGSFVRTI